MLQYVYISSINSFSFHTCREKLTFHVLEWQVVWNWKQQIFYCPFFWKALTATSNKQPANATVDVREVRKHNILMYLNLNRINYSARLNKIIVTLWSPEIRDTKLHRIKEYFSASYSGKFFSKFQLCSHWSKSYKSSKWSNISRYSFCSKIFPS